MDKHQAVAILRMIAEDQSHEQIIERLPGVTYDDIFTAAEQGARAIEAAGLPGPFTNGRGLSESEIERIRAEHPRAYLPWEAGEDAELAALCDEGWPVQRIAEHLGRQPGAIRSRMAKLKLDVD